MGTDVVVTCERWSRLVARCLLDGSTVWEARRAGGSSPVVVGDSVVLLVGDALRCHGLADGAMRWSRAARLGALVACPADEALIGLRRSSPVGESQLVSKIDPDTGTTIWDRRLPGPLSVLVTPEAILAGETEFHTLHDGSIVRTHRSPTELVALDPRSGETVQRWKLPAALRLAAGGRPSMVATPDGGVLAMVADGSIHLVSPGTGLLRTFALSDDLPGFGYQPVVAHGRLWVHYSRPNSGLAAIDLESARVVSDVLPGRPLADAVVPTSHGVLVGTQQSVVIHVDPDGGHSGRVHLGAKRLQGLLPLPAAPAVSGLAAIATTKSGLAAIDLASPS